MKLSPFFSGPIRCRLAIFGFILFSALATLTAQDKGATSTEATTTRTFKAGGESFAIPAPLKDMVEMGPDYRGSVDNLVPPFNRLIAAFVLPDDLDKIRNGSRKIPPVGSIVSVSRQYEFTEIDESGFKAIVDSVSKSFDSNLNLYANENQEEFEHRMKSLGLENLKITIDKPVSLGSLFSNQSSAGFGTILQVSAVETSSQKEASSKKMLSVCFVHVKSRVLFAYVFADYKDIETVKWLRKTSEEWADAILSANK